MIIKAATRCECVDALSLGLFVMCPQAATMVNYAITIIKVILSGVRRSDSELRATHSAVTR